MAKLVRRYRKSKKRRAKQHSNPAPRRNPPLATDVLELVGPGLLAFAATRFMTRVASTQIAKRWPKFAVHAGAAASLGSFAAAWLLGHKVKMIEKYHNAVVAGAGIAAGQSLVQLYLPKLGWIVSDATPQIAEVSTAATQPATDASTQQQSQVPSGDFEILDELPPSWRAYNDAGDPGRYAQSPPKRNAAPSQQQQAASTEDSDIFDMLETDDVNDLQAAGIFS